MFAYIGWMVWNQRNKAHVDQQAVLLNQVAEQAKQMLAQFKANLQITEVRVIDSSNGGSRWRSLQASLVKINFDGVVFSELNWSGNPR